MNKTEYAAGSNNLFTQPPPPNIASDVILQADDVGENVHKGKNDDYSDKNIVGLSIGDTDPTRLLTHQLTRLLTYLFIYFLTYLPICLLKSHAWE